MFWVSTNSRERYLALKKLLNAQQCPTITCVCVLFGAFKSFLLPIAARKYFERAIRVNQNSQVARRQNNELKL